MIQERKTAGIENPEQQLKKFGQTYWLDFLPRDIIESGDLQERVEKERARGITSNPAIFAKAIQKSDTYRDDIQRLQRKGLSNLEIYDRLMIDDIRAACDLFRPIHDGAGRTDGFVSLEVDPRLARHTESTLKEALRLHRTVNRPNCMIKIPGTAEGLEAIEEAIYRGINVNITLLFSVERYREVQAAYRRAIERRIEEHLDADTIQSVASIFLSRIDVLADELLDHRRDPTRQTGNDQTDLPADGKSAIAAARLAYDHFQSGYDDSAWKQVTADSGANPQRLLWASTSTKNPDFSPTLYVDSLVAGDTVTTLPEETFTALRKVGEPREDAIYDTTPEEAAAHWDSLDRAGIDRAYVSRRLEDEGIQKFVSPFYDAIVAIDEQR